MPSEAGIKDRIKKLGQKDSEPQPLIEELAPQAYPTKHDIEPLGIGSNVGPSMVHDLTGAEIDLAQQLTERPSVLVFFQGSWCPYCLRQLSELRTIENDLRELGFQLIALSPDRWDYINSVKDKRSLRYTLYSDHSMMAARAFGVAFKVPQKMQDNFKGFGLDLGDYHSSEHGELPVPAVFVIDQEGVVRFSYANPDIRDRADPNIVLAAARDLVQ